MKLIKLKNLNLSCPEISAASSLLNVDNKIFLCSDDQYTLYELSSNLKWNQHIWRDAPLLPNEAHALKKIKPDFESIVQLNTQEILLFPSGSKSNRNLGLRYNLELTTFKRSDLAPFFLTLATKIDSINIEGAALVGENIFFMNRGAQEKPSFIIKAMLTDLLIESIIEIDFGKLNGVTLHGSELCFFENTLYALAVAEDTDNSYDDGKIIGSSIVKISLENFKVVDQWYFDLPVKLEGLCIFQNKWLTTTDSDGLGPSEFFTFDL